MLRITVTWNAPQGAPYYSTFYFGGDVPSEADAASAAVATFLGTMDGNMSVLFSWAINTEAEFVDEATGNITGVETVPGATGTGSGAGEPLPLTTQGLVRWRTGQFIAGREIRGRTFFPGFVEGTNGLGVPILSLQTGINTAAATFITDSALAGDLVVYSPTHGTAASVNSGTFWSQWATLRSRRD